MLEQRRQVGIGGLIVDNKPGIDGDVLAARADIDSI